MLGRMAYDDRMDAHSQPAPAPFKRARGGAAFFATGSYGLGAAALDLVPAVLSCLP